MTTLSTPTTVVDSITATGVLCIKTTTVNVDSVTGDLVSQTISRTTLAPGASLTGQPAVVVAAANATWTPACLAAYATAQAAARAKRTPAPSTARTIATYEAAAQSNLDTTAKAWGYDSLLSAASYVNSSNAQFKAESLALVAWRDALWTAAYAIEAAVQAGTQALPATPAAFVALLPAAPARPTIT